MTDTSRRRTTTSRSKLSILAKCGLTAAVVIGGTVLAPSPRAWAAGTSCSAVDISFARGTGEAAGLGSVGTPFTSALTSDLAGKTVSTYAVNYAANASQTSAAPGSKDLVNHLTSVAASCPGTVFVIGGYSQGATVIDDAVGVSSYTGGSGTAIPATLAPRVKAVVVFGNPLGLQRETIETASKTYGPKAKSFCNTGDPVCGNGGNIAAHLEYASNGSTTVGATFAADKVNS